MNIPKQYTEKLQNRERCQSKAHDIGTYCRHCSNTGIEPIELIFPAKEVKDWKVGQEICACGNWFTHNLADCDLTFKILSLERKKLFELNMQQLTVIEGKFGRLNADEEMIIVRC